MLVVVLVLVLAAAAASAAAQPRRPTVAELEVALRSDVARVEGAVPAGRVLRGVVVEGRPRFARYVVPAGRCAYVALAAEAIGPSEVTTALLRGRRIVWEGSPGRGTFGAPRGPAFCATRRETLRLRVTMVYRGRGRSGEHLERVSSRFVAVLYSVPASESPLPGPHPTR